MITVQALDTSSVVSRRSDKLSQGSTRGTLLSRKTLFTPAPSTGTRRTSPQGINWFTISILVLREPTLTQRKTDTYPYRFRGELFELEIDDGVSLRHPQWSLMGTGKTLLEAEIDLLDEASEVAHAMLELPITALSFEAFRLREFLLRIT